MISSSIMCNFSSITRTKFIDTSNAPKGAFCYDKFMAKNNRRIIKLKISKKRTLGMKPELISNIGMVLTYIYILWVPFLDIHFFTTVEGYLVSFLPIFFTALVWMYGLRITKRSSRSALTIAYILILASPVIYFLLSSELTMVFGFILLFLQIGWYLALEP